MKSGVFAVAGQGRKNLWLLIALLGLTLGGCRTCPIDSCHIRKVHYHNGVKYRARPIWKMQYPAIGERIKVQHDGDNKRKDQDHSKPLK
ncbi:hypothetical protein [Hymenobacter sp. BRD67]|uniref:hypothetical protein n=1 Tax=Hymenobacter sp. BRD67 TaxID=2675877 RepID=UPI00156514DD|nr:hypothetical protein [Hymenobacter sp. BRD67]QKG52511.1 hypothetical protein GKZ67_07755 [Hymenobacter sp. BRD67]